VLHGGEGPILDKRVEMPALTKSGAEIDVELIVIRSPADGSQDFIGFLRDITAQKRVEHERARHDGAQRLLDQATVALASSLDISETMQKAARFAVPDLAD